MILYRYSDLFNLTSVLAGELAHPVRVNPFTAKKPKTVSRMREIQAITPLN